jgi:uncharacterized protein YrrD
MDIPMKAAIFCTDGHYGQSLNVIYDPKSKTITHIVVRRDSLFEEQYLVPIDKIVEAKQDQIYLSCSKSDISRMDPFVDTDFIQSDLMGPGGDPYLMWPYGAPEADWIMLERENVPPGESVIRKGAPVLGKDSRLGQVDEFIIDPKSGHIDGILLREGHLWGKKEIRIPVAHIDHIEDGKVYLKLGKDEVSTLEELKK